MRSFITCTLHHLQLKRSNQEGREGHDIWHERGKDESIWDIGGKAKRKEVSKNTEIILGNEDRVMRTGSIW
jgi:hypothetical protein